MDDILRGVQRDGCGGDYISRSGAVDDIDDFSVVGGGVREPWGAGVDSGVKNGDGDAGAVGSGGLDEMSDAGDMLGDEAGRTGDGVC